MKRESKNWRGLKMSNQAVHNVLSNYMLENANLKIALEEQKLLIEDLEKQLNETTNKPEEETTENDL